jgi:putative hemolysin
MNLELFLIFVFLCIAFLFSAGETAFFSMEKRSRTFFEKEKSGFLSNPFMIINTLLLGNNISVTLVSELSEHVINANIIRWGINPHFVSLITVVVSTIVIVIFAESIPKNLGISYPQVVYKISMPFIKVNFVLFAFLIYPITKFFQRILEVASSKIKKQKLSENEIRSIIKLSYEGDVVNPREKKLIDFIITLYTKQVYYFMVPRKDLITVSLEASIGEVWETMKENDLSSIIVTDGDIDNIAGYIFISDIALLYPSLESVQLKNKRELLHPLESVSETKRLIEVIQILGKRKKSLALIIDEYGGTAGMITFDYLIKGLLELRLSTSVNPDIDLQKGDLSSICVNPLRTTIRSLREIFYIDEEWEEDDESLAKVILNVLERFPQEGEQLMFKNFKITISKMNQNVIEQVLIERAL